MNPEVIGLIGAAIGAIAGLAGGLTVQIMQTRAQRKLRIAALGAQLATGSYIVVQAVRRASDEGKEDLTVREFVDLPAFQDALMAASELAIIAPEEVAKNATDLANSMARLPRKGAQVTTKGEWSTIFKEIRQERAQFVKSMRDSKLQLVVQTGLRALAEPAVTAIVPFKWRR